MRRRELFLGIALVAWVGAWAQTASSPAAEMAQAAQALASALNSEQQGKLFFALDDKERFDWHFIPRARLGVSFKSMSPAQQARADALLRSALSEEGHRTVNNIRLLDQVLWERTHNPIRDPALYFFTFFGQPSPGGTWGWRVEGHHLSLNFTLQGGQVISTTPFFFGANPAEVRDEGSHRGLRTLPQEEDLGRRLLKMLTAEQRREALIAVEAPADIVTGVTRRPDLGAPVGVAYSEMTAEQQNALRELLEMYARRLRKELAEAELARIRAADLEKVHFAWAGGSEPGQGHYYRLHGPTFVIEYDNTQDGANHIHTVWRDFERDFGGDPLCAHYATSPHHRHR
ncbi:MAG TPA: DUF3500 domain-containing protein [Candidatus Acidoferrales bacterium]|nr:DUF3500 domain-containing protein [Candidatus Acidoferrales bacterium]